MTINVKSKAKKSSKSQNNSLQSSENRPKDNSQGNEIDELFAKAKKEKHEKNRERVQSIKPNISTEKFKKREYDSCGDTKGTKKKTRELTDDGLSIYTDREMQIGKGGNTIDCPFDCQCCF